MNLSEKYAGHTPGPWVASHKTVIANSDIGTWSDAKNVVAYGGPLLCESIVTLENARLIAAAPDLLALADELAVCLNMLNTLVKFELEDNIIRQPWKSRIVKNDAALAKYKEMVK